MEVREEEEEDDDVAAGDHRVVTRSSNNIYEWSLRFKMVSRAVRRIRQSVAYCCKTLGNKNNNNNGQQQHWRGI